MIVVLERFDAKNFFLPVPDDILQRAVAAEGDEFSIELKCGCIVLTKIEHEHHQESDSKS